jgi:hypothetical protein
MLRPDLQALRHILRFNIQFISFSLNLALFISFMTPNDAYVTMERADSPITILATNARQTGDSPAEHVLHY